MLLEAGNAGASAAHLPGGSLDVVRNVGGITGIGLISAAVVGGELSFCAALVFVAGTAVITARGVRQRSDE